MSHSSPNASAWVRGVIAGGFGLCLIVAVLSGLGVSNQISNANQQADRSSHLIGTIADIRTESDAVAGDAIASTAELVNVSDVLNRHALLSRQILVAPDDVSEFDADTQIRFNEVVAAHDDLENQLQIASEPGSNNAAELVTSAQQLRESSRMFFDRSAAIVAADASSEPPGIALTVLFAFAALSTLVLAILYGVVTRGAQRRAYIDARTQLDLEDTERRLSKSIALGQAAILEQIASGSGLQEVRHLVQQLIAKHSEHLWRVAGQTVEPITMHTGSQTSAASPANDLIPTADGDTGELSKLDRDLKAVGERLLHLAAEHDRIADALVFQATHDPLTGLANREEVLEKLSELIEANSHPAILYIDLDRFKGVNDALGHDAGDSLLIRVAERLAAAEQNANIIGRIGGDEFAVVLSPATEDSAKAEAERLRDALSKPMVAQGIGFDVGASVGVAISTSTQDDATVLLQEADWAMYSAKQAGSRVVLVDQPLRQEYRLRRQIEHQIREATSVSGAEQGLEVYYQPIIDLTTDSIAGVESLVRLPWQGDMLLPEAFLNVARETGQLVNVDREILRRSCAQLKTWLDAGLDLTMSVNLAGNHMTRRDLREDIVAAITGADIEPQRLVIEITEDILISDPEEAARQIDSIRKLGVRVALDDFGTGYSALGYLRSFPVDTMKIDRTFVETLGQNPQSDAIVASILDLAHAFEVTVVAEGVETDVQLDRVRKLGCHEAQGFYYAHPMGAAAIPDFVKSF